MHVKEAEVEKQSTSNNANYIQQDPLDRAPMRGHELAYFILAKCNV